MARHRSFAVHVSSLMHRSGDPTLGSPPFAVRLQLPRQQRSHQLRDLTEMMPPASASAPRVPSSEVEPIERARRDVTAGGVCPLRTVP